MASEQLFLKIMLGFINKAIELCFLGIPKIYINKAFQHVRETR